MKTKLAVLTVALLSFCMVLRPSANAIGISIEVGDRPYYDGSNYWDEGYLWIWVPGHWSKNHHEWVHGHYERSGKFHKEHSHEHHRHHHDHDKDHDKKHDKDHDKKHDKDHDHDHH